GNFAELDRLAMISALERVSAVADADPRVGLTWDGENGVSLCVAGQPDFAVDDLESTTVGIMRIALSVFRLLAMLEEITRDRMRLDGEGGCYPIRVTNGSADFLAVLMPMAWPGGAS